MFYGECPDRPEVGGEVGVGEVVVGNPAIAVDAPVGGPGVADEELVGLVIIPDGQDGMVREAGFGRLGNRDNAASGGDGALETLSRRFEDARNDGG
jgi:hypothetical protein